MSYFMIIPITSSAGLTFLTSTALKEKYHRGMYYDKCYYP